MQLDAQRVYGVERVLRDAVQAVVRRKPPRVHAVAQPAQVAELPPHAGGQRRHLIGGEVVASHTPTVSRRMIAGRASVRIR